MFNLFASNLFSLISSRKKTNRQFEGFSAKLTVVPLLGYNPGWEFVLWGFFSRANHLSFEKESVIRSLQSVNRSFKMSDESECSLLQRAMKSDSLFGFEH